MYKFRFIRFTFKMLLVAAEVDMKSAEEVKEGEEGEEMVDVTLMMEAETAEMTMQTVVGAIMDEMIDD